MLKPIKTTIRNMTIRDKVISVTMLTCLSALALAAPILLVFVQISFRRTIVQDILTDADMVADNCNVALAFGNIQDVERTLASLKSKSSIVYGGIYTDTGESFASYYRKGTDKSVKPAGLKQDGFYFDDGFLTVFKSIVLDNDKIGTLCIRSNLEPLQAILSQSSATIIFVLAIALLAAYLLSARLQKIISIPILKLAEIAKIVSDKKDYSIRAQKQSNDEVGFLINSFNEMLKEIEQHEAALLDANQQLTKEVTERRKTEEQLRKTEEKYRIQFEGALDAIFTSDAETGILTDCNPAATRLIGREKSEMVGKHQRILHPPEEIKAEFSKTFKQHLKEKQGQVLETQIITKNGEIRDVAIKATLLEIGGKKVLQGIFRDITERKIAEQRQTQLVEQLEKTNQELKDFAYIVSHDLKAPLRGIKVLVEWIATDYADRLDEEGKEQINLLLSRVERMRNLIDGILQYSRIGRDKEEMVVVNLNELIPDIIDILAPPKNIAVTIRNELPTIKCEQTRVTQIFQNLLSNAIKYMDKPQGQIKIDCVEEDGFWKFSIADNGPGIEEQYFEKIFRMFQTLSSRDEFESTGVGLTVVKKIVESYGGNIWVESKVGEGSTFFFTLPIQKMGVDSITPQTIAIS